MKTNISMGCPKLVVFLRRGRGERLGGVERRGTRVHELAGRSTAAASWDGPAHRAAVGQASRPGRWYRAVQ